MWFENIFLFFDCVTWWGLCYMSIECLRKFTNLIILIEVLHWWIDELRFNAQNSENNHYLRENPTKHHYRDLDRLGEWCPSNKFDLNDGKCKLISFCHNMRPIEFVYSIIGPALERVNQIKDFGVIIDEKMSPNNREF
jgi:hypothetical protein